MSAKYREFTGLNLPSIEQEVLSKWSETQAFEKSVSLREGATPFVFYEGPPSANGMPGIHHVISRTLKDLVCRYKTMKGFQVKRKGGWDTHGLPIELGVEKELGITKEDIGVKISVEEYNRKCREAVLRYKDKWDQITTQMGYWVDLQHPYITFENSYIETLWWLLSELYKKGLLYQSVSIQPYSPAAGTGLSSHELNQPGTYKDVKDTSCVAMFKAVKNERSEFLFSKLQTANPELFFLAWTTTPWTLPSNLALAVGPEIEYAVMELAGVRYVLAEARLAECTQRAPHPRVERQGEALLRAAHDRVRQQAAQRLHEQPLRRAAPVGLLHGVGQRGHQLHQLMIEQRDACLQRGRHAHLVNLHQGKVALSILGCSNFPFNAITSVQVKATNLRRRNINIVRRSHI